LRVLVFSQARLGAFSRRNAASAFIVAPAKTTHVANAREVISAQTEPREHSNHDHDQTDNVNHVIHGNLSDKG
jgi:hypothetical protein